MSESVPEYSDAAPEELFSPAPRRKKSQTRQRKHRGVGHYDEPEYALYRAAYEKYLRSPAAAAYGESESGFIRWCTIGKGARRLPRRLKAAGVPLPPNIRNQLGAIMVELSRIGSNINQIAKHLNAGDRVRMAVIRTAQNELRETMKALRRLAGLEG